MLKSEILGYIKNTIDILKLYNINCFKSIIKIGIFYKKDNYLNNNVKKHYLES